MKWVDDIFSVVWDISDWFRSAYVTTSGWVWPFNNISPIFLSLSDWFWKLLTPIANFGDWADDVWSKVRTILTTEVILGLIKSWYPWLEGIGSWFNNIGTWVLTVIGDWWLTATTTVKDWISTATEGLPTLKVAWGNFFTVTLPTLFDLKYAEEWWKGKVIDLNTLIESKLNEWFPQYDTEAEQQPTRISFFVSPLDWLLEQFTDWFLGKE